MNGHQIGDCTLLHANSLDALPTIGAVDHIVTDPPYEQRLHEAAKTVSNYRVDNGPELREIPFESIDVIRADFINLAQKVSKGWFVGFCNLEGVAKWADAINASDMKYKKACVWVKPDATPQFNGQCPATGAECFVTAWCGSGKSKWNAGGKRGVYTHLTNSKDRHGVHPTEKPLRLMKELLADFTNEGDLICDPFMGSGTTGVACASMGRKFVGVELNRNYFDIAVKRIGDAYKQPDLFVPQPVAI